MPLIFNNLDPLFTQYHLGSLIRNQTDKIAMMLDQIHDDPFLATPTEDIVENIHGELHLPPLALSDEGRYRAPTSFNTYAGPDGSVRRGSYFLFEYEYDYTGASGLFRHQPARRDMDPPRVNLIQGAYRGTVVIQVKGNKATEAEVKAEVDAQLAKIKRFIEYQADELTPYNDGLRDKIRAAVDSRKATLLEARRIAASLGYPLVHIEGAPQFYAALVTRKPIVPLPLGPAGFAPEWALLEEMYQEILGIIHSMTQVMERSPSAFVNMREEDIRVHYLVQLNGRFKGAATGETFNLGGKTDILLRVEDRTIFIAEFKFWDGEKSLIDAIDQVLGYTSWRDTKVAIVLLSRNKNFGDVLTKAKAATVKHPHYKRGETIESETKFRYVFGNPNDHSREIILTVMVFDVPQAV